MPTTTSIYERYEQLTDQGPAPLLMLSCVFVMLAVGSAAIGFVVAAMGGLPFVVAIVPAVLLALVAAGLLAGDFGMRRRR